MTATRTLFSTLGGLLLIASSAVAQDATETPSTDAETPEAAETEASPETAPEAETGDAAPAAASPAPSPTSTAIPENLQVETHGAWETRCNTETGACFMYHLARDTGGNPVAEFTLIDLPEGGEADAGATVITPLGTLLTDGLVMQIDSSEARQYAFNWCDRSGCYARFGLAPGEIAAMKRGAAARIQLRSVSAPDQPVLLEISLTGFTAAFDALPDPS